MGSRVEQRVLWLLLTVFWIFLVLYSIWSFSLTDPNLVFTSWQPYWNAQQWLWQKIFADSQLQTKLYVSLVASLVIVYLGILHLLHKMFANTPVSRSHWIVLAVVLSPLVFSYNALSHDLFNYMFNSKMVVVYGANPHKVTALEFSDDAWVRFMHNTHTVAPYGYVWTAASLLPYILGFGKFTITWLLYKATAAASFVLLAVSINWFAVQIRKKPLQLIEAALFFLNPLVIIEVLGNGHNDLWMMIPAIFALGIAIQWGSKKLPLFIAIYSFSILVKYASIVLLPVFIVILYAENVWQRLRSRLLLRIPLALVVPVLEKAFGTYVRGNVVGILTSTSALLLLIPLLTHRSQQFHPWYLLWALVWLPFISVRFIRALLVALSISSLLRYVPWMLSGGYSSVTLGQQQHVTWVGGLILLLIWIVGNTLQIRNQSGMLKRL